MQRPSILKLQEQDNVAVALRPLHTGELVQCGSNRVAILQDIPQGHKLALQDIPAGGNVIKYGSPIGHTTAAAAQGSHLHTHNLQTNLSGELAYTYSPSCRAQSYPKQQLFFSGYRRQNGSVGIRNDLYIIPTVGCVNGTAERIVRAYEAANGSLTASFDNVIVLKHPYGCSQLGDDHAATRRMLANAALHPNAGAVLVLGLGCENNTMERFLQELGDYDQKRVRHLVAQEVQDEIAEGVRIIGELVQTASGDRRLPVPIAELRVGLKCGGSDGFSGITANPLLGVFSDFLVAQGGSTVLTEVPEMFGAEEALMARAKDEAVFQKIVSLINNFKAYYAQHGEPCYENPSPGNKAGGISTLEDKALGCTQKSGSSAVVEVLAYGERINQSGLSLLEAPGNDLVAASALAGAGCQLVLFTTGRGTPFGSFVPTMKIATNTQLFEQKGNWMDFNAGRLLDEPMDAVRDDFLQAVIDIASGTPTKNETNCFSEIAIFKNGVTL